MKKKTSKTEHLVTLLIILGAVMLGVIAHEAYHLADGYVHGARPSSICMDFGQDSFASVAFYKYEIEKNGEVSVMHFQGDEVVPYIITVAVPLGICFYLRKRVKVV